jgi:hypothetical protein
MSSTERASKLFTQTKSAGLTLSFPPRKLRGTLVATLLMEFFLILVLGAIVIWLVSKRSADHQHVQQL